VPRQLHDHVRGHHVEALLEDVSGAGVQAGPTRRAEIRVEGVGDELVREAHRASHRRLVDEQTGGDGRVKAPQNGRLGGVDHVDQHVLRDVLTDNGRRGQHRGGVIAK
jgi:hypothetical protein